MNVDLERRSILIKTKNTNKQPANNSSDRGGDECHNTTEGEQTHSGEVEIVDLV
jgi:hypothetical protein